MGGGAEDDDDDDEDDEGGGAKRQADGRPRRGASNRKRRLRRGWRSASAQNVVAVLVAAVSVAKRANVTLERGTGMALPR